MCVSQVEHDCSFYSDLGADLFMFMELVSKIEDEFGQRLSSTPFMFCFCFWTEKLNENKIAKLLRLCFISVLHVRTAQQSDSIYFFWRCI